VLAAFMAGSAWGFVVGGRADRTPRPLALYAALELGIGLVGLVSPLALAQGNEMYASFYRRWHESPGLLTMARFAIGFAFVFVPAFLMGGTLPAATRHLPWAAARVGPAVGRLYAVNTLGAACGALLLPYVLLPALGVRTTLVATALTNLALAAAALRGVRGAPLRAPTTATGAAPGGAQGRPALLAAFFLSGFVALALEVLWNRFFSMYIGSSIYSYAIVLTLYLVGIFAGGLLCERLMLAGRPAESIVVAALTMAWWRWPSLSRCWIGSCTPRSPSSAHSGSASGRPRPPPPWRSRSSCCRRRWRSGRRSRRLRRRSRPAQARPDGRSASSIS
jgi:spermidine synthase